MFKFFKTWVLIGAIFCTISTNAQVLPVRDQATLINKVLEDRLNNLLPQLMNETGIDCWIVISREYNEDPVLKTMLPAEWLNARRTTILVLYRNAQTGLSQRWAIARYSVGNLFKANWDMKKFPNQWDALANLIKEINPTKIGLNYDTDFAEADGLHVTELNLLKKYLSTTDQAKFVSAKNLAIRWLETRTPFEMELYPTLIDITHNIIKKGFSREVITPGYTTAEDLEWWFRQELKNMGLETWFHPSIYIQRRDGKQFDHLKAFSREDGQNTIIQHGDLIHVDFGISYLRLNSDIQEMAYILMPNETQPPTELVTAFKKTNTLQDILTAQFKEGRTGNEILKAALATAQEQGIKATIYTHPLGLHGHAAGPTIGLWDMQQGVPGSGDYPMFYNTCYSIELNAAYQIWNKEVKIMLEQNGCFTQDGFRYLLERQTDLIVIK
ncbi:MAG: M24 family metallopeptidase [Alphaproteobacteria bacterium]|nr:M24 family metallopeptidase [Alphaproteobacteria bacterium]